MVSISGLTRSKGRVSQAGSTATAPRQRADDVPSSSVRGVGREQAGQVVGQPLGVDARRGHDQRAGPAR